jgi:uncharacterized protein
LTASYRIKEKLMPILIDDLKALALVGSLRTSGAYVALIILMGVFLSARVILQRRSKLIGIGDGGDKVAARIIRAQANFCEYAPFAMALLILLPLLGTASWIIHAVGIVFLLGRAAHAYALSLSAGSSIGRVGGMVLTFTALLIGAVALLAAAF